MDDIQIRRVLMNLSKRKAEKDLVKRNLLNVCKYLFKEIEDLKQQLRDRHCIR